MINRCMEDLDCGDNVSVTVLHSHSLSPCSGMSHMLFNTNSEMQVSRFENRALLVHLY